MISSSVVFLFLVFLTPMHKIVPDHGTGDSEIDTGTIISVIHKPFYLDETGCPKLLFSFGAKRTIIV